MARDAASIEKLSFGNCFGRRIRFATKTPTARRSSHDDVGQPKRTWTSRPSSSSVLVGKPAAIMGATPGGTGTARAQLALRQSFVFTQTPCLPGPEVLVAEAGSRFAADGTLTDEATRKHVRQLLERLVAWTERLGAR